MKHTEIILIDDDPISLMISKFLFAKMFGRKDNITLTSFTIPLEGLKHISDLVKEKKTDKSRLKILLDINMPIINGWDFLKRLNLFDPEKKIRVIMHSSSKNQADISMAFVDSRVESYIPKPMEVTKAQRAMSIFTSESQKNNN